MYLLYKIFLFLLIIISPFLIIIRLLIGKESTERFKEKFCFFSSKYILNSKGAGINKSYIGYVIDKYRSIDIDDINDWKFAEAIWRK